MAKKEEKKFLSGNFIELIGHIDKMTVRSGVSKKTGGSYLMGDLNIVTGEGERHFTRFMTMQYGRSNPDKELALYTSIKELVAKGADSDKLTEEEKKGFRVRVVAQWQPNVYKNRAGEVVETVQLSVRNVRDAYPDEKNKSNFKVTGAVSQGAKTEVDYNGDETDRRDLNLVLTDFRGIGFKVDFVVPDYGADWAETLEVGDTISVDGDVLSRYLIEEIETTPENGFGTQVDTKRDIKRENIMTGASIIKTIDEADDEESDGNDTSGFLTTKTLREALEEYSKWKEEEIARADASKKSSSNSSKKPSKNDSPFESRDSSSKGSSNSQVSGIDDSDLPF